MTAGGRWAACVRPPLRVPATLVCAGPARIVAPRCALRHPLELLTWAATLTTTRRFYFRASGPWILQQAAPKPPTRGRGSSRKAGNVKAAKTTREPRESRATPEITGTALPLTQDARLSGAGRRPRTPRETPRTRRPGVVRGSDAALVPDPSNCMEGNQLDVAALVAEWRGAVATVACVANTGSVTGPVASAPLSSAEILARACVGGAVGSRYPQLASLVAGSATDGGEAVFSNLDAVLCDQVQCSALLELSRAAMQLPAAEGAGCERLVGGLVSALNMMVLHGGAGWTCDSVAVPFSHWSSAVTLCLTRLLVDLHQLDVAGRTLAAGASSAGVAAGVGAVQTAEARPGNRGRQRGQSQLKARRAAWAAQTRASIAELVGKPLVLRMVREGLLPGQATANDTAGSVCTIVELATALVMVHLLSREARQAAAEDVSDRGAYCDELERIAAGCEVVLSRRLTAELRVPTKGADGAAQAAMVRGFASAVDTAALLAQCEGSCTMVTQAGVAAHLRGAVAELCQDARALPVVFSVVLCSPVVATRVRGLGPADWRAFFHSCVFGAASMLADRTAVGGGVGCTSSRLGIARQLLAAGYDAADLLASGFCVGCGVGELLEVLATAATLLPETSLGPLPARVHGSLLGGVQQELVAAVGSRGVGSASVPRLTPTMLLELQEGDCPCDRGSSTTGLAGMMARWHAASTAPTVVAQAVGHDDGGRVTGALCHGTGVLVEMMARGDGKAVGQVLPPLLTVLEQEGGARFLDEGLRVVLDLFAKRMGPVSSASGGARSLSLEMESALCDVCSGLASRFVEAAHRQLARLRRASVSGVAEVEAALQLQREALGFTARVCSGGVLSGQSKQLVGLHAALEAVLAPAPGLVQWRDALPEVLLSFVTEVIEAPRRFGLQRHPEAPGLRQTGALAMGVVAAYLPAVRGPLAALVEARGVKVKTKGKSAVRRARHAALADAAGERYLLCVVRLLRQLLTQLGHEGEPAELRRLRTDVLDPAVTQFLSSALRGSRDGEATLPSLSTLADVALVQCVSRTIHHVSLDFFRSLTEVTVAAVNELEAGGATASVTETAGGEGVSAAARRLLVASAPVCQLGDAAFVEEFNRQALALSCYLKPEDAIAVLSVMSALRVPVPGALDVLAERLAKEAGSEGSTLSLTLRVAAVEELGACGWAMRAGPGRSASMLTVLRGVSRSPADLSVGDAGRLAGVVARLLRSGGDALAGAEAKEMARLPITLCDTVMNGRFEATPSDVATVLRGYAALPDTAEYATVKKTVVSGFILRTTQVAPLLSPLEVVQCIESLVEARVRHEYLFGVLLARVGDVRSKFTLPLAIRLVDCGVASSYDVLVQTGCRTAAQPILVGIIRGRLQADPVSLAAVGDSAASVLRCLRSAFPQDPINDAVLRNIVTHISRVSVPVLIAALRLVEVKGTTEYVVLRVIMTHATERVIPHAAHAELADVALLLVRCGVRAAGLLAAVTDRMAQVHETLSGASLGKLCHMYLLAKVDDLRVVVPLVAARVLTLVQDSAKDPVKGNAVATPNEGRLSATDAVAAVALLQAGTGPAVVASQTALVGYLTQLLQLPQPPHTSDETTQREDLSENASRGSGESDDGDGPPCALLSPAEINTLLSACRARGIRCEPGLVRACAEQLRRSRRPHSWQLDLALTVSLAQALVGLDCRDEALLSDLLGVIYDKRAALLKRQLLLQKATETIVACGDAAHPALHAFLVGDQLTA